MEMFREGVVNMYVENSFVRDLSSSLQCGMFDGQLNFSD